MGDQRRELGDEDAARRRGHDRVGAGEAADLGERLPLGLERLGHALEDHVGGGERGGRIRGVDPLHARGDRLDGAFVHRAESGEAVEAGADLGEGLVAQARRGRGLAPARIDQGDR